jgi:NitT/TauT family transport system substrate-binding protein
VRRVAAGSGAAHGGPGRGKEDRRMLRKMLALGAVLLALAAWPTRAQERLVLGFPSAPLTVQFAYLAFGEELGFFRDENIKPEYSLVTGSAVLFPQIATGRVDIGLPNPDFLVIAAAKGEPLPVRFVMNWFRSHGFEFVVLDKSPVRQLSDLKGKKLGVGALTFGNIPLSRAMLASVGVGWGRDIEVLPVGIGPAAWRRLETGEIDALNLFVSQHGAMELAGIPIRRLALPERFRAIFSNGWAASNDLIEKKPRVIEGFGRAVVKSWLACKENLEACVRAHWWRYPAEAPPADKEAEQLRVDMKRALFDGQFIDDFAGGPPLWGHYPEEIWSRLVEIMHAERQIARKDIDLSSLYTDRFVEAFNRFDQAAVLQAARDAKRSP